MFKFLLYLFLFYIVSRFIFGRLFGIPVRGQIFYGAPPRKPADEKPEGAVTIDPQTAKTQKNDSQLGEYVDFEEVK